MKTGAICEKYKKIIMERMDFNVFNLSLQYFTFSHFFGSRFLHRTLLSSMKIPRQLGCKKKACIFRAAVYFRDSFRENKGSRAPRQKKRTAHIGRYFLTVSRNKVESSRVHLAFCIFHILKSSTRSNVLFRRTGLIIQLWDTSRKPSGIRPGIPLPLPPFLLPFSTVLYSWIAKSMETQTRKPGQTSVLSKLAHELSRNRSGETWLESVPSASSIQLPVALVREWTLQ